MASRKIALVIFVTALAVRLLNTAAILGGPQPHLTPLDDLYHWKRITFSAAHFPAVLEFDPDRGERGAFCPWPPLYDLTCGAIARLFGMNSVLWVPPIVSAICVAIATLFIGRFFGSLAAIAAGIALATAPFIVTESSVGDIDHHYLEWPLVFAMIFAIQRRSWKALAIAMTIAMFVQTALLPACALAFVAAFVIGDRRFAAAFGIVAMMITIYRLTHSALPTSPWFLGWPHVALFGAAAVALFFRRWPVVAVIVAAAVLIAFRSSIVGGLHFFGGDPWLSTISEFQPVWKGDINDWLSYAAGFSAGAILVWDLARRAIRHRDARIGTIALFAIVYFALAITSRRFDATAVPLLALAGAVDAAMILRRKLAMFAAAAIAFVPAVQLAIWMSHPLPPIAPDQQPWIRASAFLRTRPPGRVLAPWPLGHCLDVLGRHAVVIDNFGTMPDPAVFERATAALGSDDLTEYCTRVGVRYVIRQRSPGRRFRLAYSDGGLNLWESLDLP